MSEKHLGAWQWEPKTLMFSQSSQNSRQTPSTFRRMRQKDDLKIYSVSTLFSLSYSAAFYGLFLSPDTAFPGLPGSY